MEKYVIKKGDTLTKLAKNWGCTVNDILSVNPTILNANKIYVGKIIYKPSTKESTITDDELLKLIKTCVSDIQKLKSFQKVCAYFE